MMSVARPSFREKQPASMNKARFSVLVFGFYMVFVAGLGFMAIPMLILSLLRVSAGDDVWVRFVGMLASILGGYYILVARSGLDRFVPWTIPTRYFAASFMVLMVVLGKIGPGVLLLAAIDAGAATWTWLALRSAVRENAEAGSGSDAG